MRLGWTAWPPNESLGEGPKPTRQGENVKPFGSNET
jgi:hypothetical protein